MKSVTYTIPYSTQIKFNDTITLPADITEIVIEATSEYIATPYISAIKFNSIQMKYNDGNTDYTVYSSGKWASDNVKTIVTVNEYIIETQEEKAWWLDNTDLTEDKLGNGKEIVEPEIPSTNPTVIWLKNKFPLVEWSNLEWVYERSVNIYLEKVFPYNYDIVDIPIDRPRAKNWIKACCLYILKLNNITDGLPLTAYAENGMSMHFDSSMLSDELLSTLPPPMAVVRGSRR